MLGLPTISENCFDKIEYLALLLYCLKHNEFFYHLYPFYCCVLKLHIRMIDYCFLVRLNLSAPFEIFLSSPKFCGIVIIISSSIFVVDIWLE